MRRAPLRRRLAKRIAAVWRVIAAPPGNAIGRMAWRCRRAGIAGGKLDALGDSILARLQAGIVKVGHGVYEAQPVPAPAIEMPEIAATTVPTMAEPAVAAAVASAEAGDGAIIYAWPSGSDAAGRMLSLRAWLDYMRERGRLSPHEWSRLCEFGRAPEGLQYLIRLRDYYDGSGPYPGDPFNEPALRTGTAA